MYTFLGNKMFLSLILSFLLLSTSPSKADADSPKNHCGWSAEKMLLAELKLEEDVSDNKIIQLLDVPAKRIFAATLIRYKRISSATPKLLEIVRDKKATIPAKLTAAKALCDFGNKDWRPLIKVLLKDKNNDVHIPFKLDVAALLARSGDYSQFDIVADQIDNSKYAIRMAAVEALGNFQHKNETVTNSAVDLLTFVATSDPHPVIRTFAIESLEKIATKKPTITSRVVNALEANIDSTDKNLQVLCKAKLKGRYKR